MGYSRSAVALLDFSILLSCSGGHGPSSFAGAGAAAWSVFGALCQMCVSVQEYIATPILPAVLYTTFSNLLRRAIDEIWGIIYSMMF